MSSMSSVNDIDGNKENVSPFAHPKKTIKKRRGRPRVAVSRQKYRYRRRQRVRGDGLLGVQMNSKIKVSHSNIDSNRTPFKELKKSTQSMRVTRAVNTLKTGKTGNTDWGRDGFLRITKRMDKDPDFNPHMEHIATKKQVRSLSILLYIEWKKDHFLSYIPTRRGIASPREWMSFLLDI